MSLHKKVSGSITEFCVAFKLEKRWCAHFLLFPEEVHIFFCLLRFLFASLFALIGLIGTQRKRSRNAKKKKKRGWTLCRKSMKEYHSSCTCDDFLLCWLWATEWRKEKIAQNTKWKNEKKKERNSDTLGKNKFVLFFSFFLFFGLGGCDLYDLKLHRQTIEKKRISSLLMKAKVRSRDLIKMVTKRSLWIHKVISHFLVELTLVWKKKLWECDSADPILLVFLLVFFCFLYLFLFVAPHTAPQRHSVHSPSTWSRSNHQFLFIFFLFWFLLSTTILVQFSSSLLFFGC